MSVLGEVAVVVDPEQQLRQLRSGLAALDGRQYLEEEVGLPGKVLRDAVQLPRSCFSAAVILAGLIESNNV